MDGGQALSEAPLAGVIPPPRPLSILAGMRAGRETWIGAVPAAAYEQPVFAHRTVVGTQWLVSDPDAIRRVLMDNADNYPKLELQRDFLSLVFGDGLLVSEGETWRRHRRLMAPAFDPRAAAGYAPAMVQAAQGLAAGWEGLAPGAEIDVFEAMRGLALRIISRTMFSADGEAMEGLAGAAMETALGLRPALLDFVPGLTAARMRGRHRRTAAIFAPFDEAVLALIARRRAAGDSAPEDLLTRLIAAGLSDAEVRDQVVTIFLAGHETTAVALTWVWYLLAQRPAAEARLHEELETALGGRAPTAADAERLLYTRAVVDETLRLYPAGGLLGRRARAADTLAGQPIPARAIVFISPWIVHRHQRNWSDPDRFEPERFLAGAGAGRPRLAYIPFGAGPHICIGMPMALMEVVLALAILAQRFRLTLAPGQDVRLQHRATLRPIGGMRMRVERL